MLGKTNACVGGSGGGSGETIEVLNKTGAVINQGDKVWLSENTQVAGTGNTVGDSFHYRDYPHNTGVLSRSGNFMVFTDASYSISADTVTKIGSFTCDVGNIKYGPNQSIFSVYNKTTYRIDEGNQYNKGSNYVYIGEDFAAYYSSTAGSIDRFNIEDGSLLEERPAFYVGNESFQIMLNDTIIYDLKRWEKGIYNNSTWDRTSLIAPNAQNVYPLNATLDKKYIIGSSVENSFINAANLYSYLRLIEIIDDIHVKVLTQSEMPEDLQTYYSAPCYIAFNPYTGILTVCEKDSQNYAVVRYKNGEWLKIPMTFGLSSNNCFYGGMTISDDLSRISYVDASKGSTYIYQRITNLTSTEGYSAIPYKPYTVNENTITATALAESQPNELTPVQIGSVTNEDLTVTENGTYTPSATYTGFGSVNVNVKGAETMQVPNKTGSAITRGQKVWLSENTQSAGFLYNVGDSIPSGNYSRAGVLSRSGNFMVFNNKTYSIGTKTEGYTQLGNFEAIVYSIIYAPNQAIFARGITSGTTTKRTYRVDEGNQYMVDNAWYVGEDYFIYRATGAIWVYKYNLDSGAFINSFKIEDTLFSYADANNIIIKNDEIYVLYNTSSTTSSWCKFVYEESSWVKKTISVSNRQGYNGFPLGFTADGKYIICGNGFTSSSTGNLRLVEVIDDTHMRILTQAEMPADLQTFYSAYCMCAFNPYTGVLTACVQGSADYVIMKYENGEWNKVAVDWNTGSNKFYGGITVSDDLSRISVLTSSFQNVYNLTSTDGYSAIPYKPYTVNEQSLAGYAMTDAEPNETVTVSVPAEV